MDRPEEDLDRTLPRQEASAAVTGLGWRYVLGLLRTSLPAGSLAGAADIAGRVVAACGAEADGRLWIDLRRDQLVLSLQSPAAAEVTPREVALARRISEVAGGLGLATGAGVGGDAPRSVQVLEIAIDAMDIAAVRPFWKAVLGYSDEPGRSGPEDALVDPVGQGPAVWFQQMAAPRATASTSTSRSPTTRPNGASGPPWPPAAGSSTTPRPPPSGSWPTPRATRPASPPGRVATPRPDRRLGPAGLLPVGGDPVEHLQQLPDVERLGQEAARPLLEQPLDEPGPGAGGEDHHPDPGRPRAGLEAAQDRLPGHVGQVQVEQDQVGVVVGGQVEAELGPHGRDQAHARPAAQDPLDRAQVGQVVLDVEHGQGRPGRLLGRPGIALPGGLSRWTGPSTRPLARRGRSAHARPSTPDRGRWGSSVMCEVGQSGGRLEPPDS